MIRQQLPVHSPLEAGSLGRGILGFARGGNRHRDRLTRLLRREYGAEAAILCGSGTQALQLALIVAAREVGGGPVVALPAFSCFDVVSAAVGADLPVTFYDVDPATLSPAVESLEDAFRRGARVAVVGHLYGVPVRWRELQACARRHGALLVEDAAQGHGGSLAGAPLGALGDLAVLSFGRGKGWTGGGGGALLLRSGTTRPSAALQPFRSPRAARALLATAAQWAVGRPSLYGLPRMLPGLHLGETVYHSPLDPTEMGEGAAAILLNTWKAAGSEAAERRRRAARLGTRLSRLGDVALTDVPEDGEAGYLRLPLRVPDGLASLAPGASRFGVAPSYPLPLNRLVPIQPLLTASTPGRFPGAEELAHTLITFPTHSRVTDDEEDLLPRLLSGGSHGDHTSHAVRGPATSPSMGSPAI